MREKSDAPLRILIVEDEALLAMELEGLIEDCGHVVAGWVTNYEAACRAVEEQHVDVAFVDVNIAGSRTGIDLARYLADDDKPIVVFLTANARRLPEDYAGAVGVIAKPYSMSGLKAALLFLHEGLTQPPPTSDLPVGFTLSPAYAENWKSD